MLKLENEIFKLLKNSIKQSDVISKISINFSTNQIDLSKEELLNDNSDILDKIPSAKGLYYFEIKQISQNKSWENFKESWSKIENSSPIIKRMWDAHSFNNSVYFPFYIGRSIDSLKDRIKEHTFSKTKKGHLKNTKALRLSEHFSDENISDVMDCFLFRVAYSELDLEYELLSILESMIRNKKKCFVGRDRT